MPIDITLEKRCIKYLWNLINSKCKLYNNNNNKSFISDNSPYGYKKIYINTYYKQVKNNKNKWQSIKHVTSTHNHTCITLGYLT